MTRPFPDRLTPGERQSRRQAPPRPPLTERLQAALDGAARALPPAGVTGGRGEESWIAALGTASLALLRLQPETEGRLRAAVEALASALALLGNAVDFRLHRERLGLPLPVLETEGYQVEAWLRRDAEELLAYAREAAGLPAADAKEDTEAGTETEATHAGVR